MIERTESDKGDLSGSERVSHGYDVMCVVNIEWWWGKYSDKIYITKEGEVASSDDDM